MKVKNSAKKVEEMFGGFSYFLYLCIVKREMLRALEQTLKTPRKTFAIICFGKKRAGIEKREAATRCSWSQQKFLYHKKHNKIMAQDYIPFLVNLRQNENTESKNYGQYYPEAEGNTPLNLKGFAKHLAEHGKLASYEMLVLVLQNIVDCMTHLVATGQPVKLDGLGTFYPTIEGKGEDSVELAVQNLVENIKGVHLRFRPEGEKGGDLTSRMLKERCIFEAYQLVKTNYVTMPNGKKKSYQTRTPLSTYAIQQQDTPPEP